MRQHSIFGDSGVVLVCEKGDDLAKIPPAYRHLITPDIRNVFTDPEGYFRNVAERCQFPKVAEWLRVLTEKYCWHLELVRSQYAGERAGFRWKLQDVFSVTIGLPLGEDLSKLPPEMAHYYSLLDFVDPFPYEADSDDATGNLYSVKHLHLLSTVTKKRRLPVDPFTTYVWGNSMDGDSLFFTPDGRGGWYLLAEHLAHVLGTIAQTIDNIYSQLLAGELPKDRRG